MLLLTPLALALSGSHLATDGHRVLSVWNGGIASLGPIDVRLVDPDGTVSAPQRLGAEGICGVAWTGHDYALGTVSDHEIRVRRITAEGAIGAPRVVGRSNDRDGELAGWHCSLAAAEGRVWMAWRTCPTLRYDGCDAYDPELGLVVVEVGEGVTPLPMPEPRRLVGLGALGATPTGPVLYWEHRPTSNPGTCRIATLAPGAPPPVTLPCDTTTFGGGWLLLRRGSHRAELWSTGGLRTAFEAPELGLMETVTAEGPEGPVVFVHGGGGRVRLWDGHTLNAGPDGFVPRAAVWAGGTWIVETWTGELVWVGADGRPLPYGVQPLAGLPTLVGAADLGEEVVVVHADATGLHLLTGDGRAPTQRTTLSRDGRAAVVDPVGRTVHWRDPEGAWTRSLAPGAPPARRVDPIPVLPAPTRAPGDCVDAGRWQVCPRGDTVAIVDRAHQTVDGRPLADQRPKVASQTVAVVTSRAGRLTVDRTLSGPVLDRVELAGGGPGDGTWLVGFDDLVPAWFAAVGEAAFVAPWVADVPRRPRLVARFTHTAEGVTRTVEVYADGRVVHEHRRHDCWGPQDPALPICDPAPDEVDRREHTLDADARRRWITAVAPRDPALARDLASMLEGGGPARVVLPEWAAAALE